MRTTPQTLLVLCLCLCLCLLIAQEIAQPSTANANDLWQAAKDYSAGLAKAAKDTADAAVKAARDALDRAIENLKTAALALIPIIGFCPQAILILLQLLSDLAIAQAALAAAIATAKVLTAVFLGILGGTIIGELVDWAISRCWDPPCVMVATSPSYTPLSDAQIDALLPDLLHMASVNGLTATHADFDSADVVTPGSGTAAWNFLHAGTRLFCISTEGAGSATAHLCSDVSLAASDMQSGLSSYISSISAFTPYIEDATIYSGDPRPQLAAARASAVSLISDVTANPGCYSDPMAALNAGTQVLNSLDAASAAITAASDTMGMPRPLEGPSGYLSSLSLTEFQRFLSDCATKGKSALPPGEAAIADTILSRMGLRFDGVVGAGWDVAAYVGEGDQGNESSLFASGPMKFSEILNTSIGHHWSLVAPFTSRTLTQCSITGAPVTSVNEAPLTLRVQSNPAGASPVFWVNLRDAGQATVRVYGVTGALVEQVYSGYLPKGPHRFELRRSGAGENGLASGIYYVRVVAGAAQQSERFSIVR